MSSRSAKRARLESLGDTGSLNIRLLEFRLHCFDLFGAEYNRELAEAAWREAAGDQHKASALLADPSWKSRVQGATATRPPQVEGVVVLKKDEEFWFQDGSVILVAGDVQFKVYQGVLATHSPVFKDMFSLPQPASTSTSSGTSICPAVVHLTDHPADVREVLRVLLPKSQPRYVKLHIRTPPAFSNLSFNICQDPFLLSILSTTSSRPTSALATSTKLTILSRRVLHI